MSRLPFTGFTSLALITGIAISPAIQAEHHIDFYAKIHISADAADDGNESQTGLSNNSSRFGFQGTHQATPDLEFYWRMEQKVYVDESGGKLGNPTYAGLSGSFGKVQAGFMDTPYKSLVSPFNIMDDTVGDVRGILGFSALGDDADRNMNVRARNALMAQKAFDKLTLSALYSFDYVAEETDSGLDDNEYDGYSLSAVYKDDQWLVGVAAEQWQDDEAINGVRAGVRYDFGAVNAGLMLENIDSDVTEAYRRQAVAIDMKYKWNEQNTLKLQYAVADDHDGGSNTGARQIAIGNYYAVSDAMKFYLIYSQLSNDDNAKYRLGTSGHGDVIEPAYGDDPWALSLGLSYRIDYRML